MRDSIILYPLVYRSDMLYTKYNITPNMITLTNNLIVTPIALIYLELNNIYMTFIFLYLRCLLDSIDGYIARKYKLITILGEIYDHVSDSIYAGYITHYSLNKMGFFYSSSISFIFAIFTVIVNFNPTFKFIGERIMGSGGNENTYSTLINLLPVLFMNF